MKVIAASKARASFGRLARGVIRNRKPVVVRFPTGLVQMVPYDQPTEVTPNPKGSIRRTRREIALGNTLGESL